MTLPIYLAMTSQEMGSCTSLPAHFAYMACHFSPYGTGLCDLPDEIPAGSVLILNDRVPICGHDPQVILQQLENFCSRAKPSAILLDLQRSGCEELVGALVQGSSIPVCVSQRYAHEPDTGVLLEMPPVHVPLEEHIKNWSGRKVWLDIAPQCFRYRIDEKGCRWEEHPLPRQEGSQINQLQCHCVIEKGTDFIDVILYRSDKDLRDLLTCAWELGIENVIGLYQQLGGFPVN